jgi:hypothetical protein
VLRVVLLIQGPLTEGEKAAADLNIRDAMVLSYGSRGVIPWIISSAALRIDAIARGSGAFLINRCRRFQTRMWQVIEP